MKELNDYQIGDLVETYDKSVGLIVDKISAFDHLCLDVEDVNNKIFEHFNSVSMYKILIHGTICFINDTNIKGVVECAKKREKL